MNTIDWLTRLVSFDTTSCNSNLELITEISNWFKKHNIPVKLTYDDTKEKANLFATIPAVNGSTNHGLVLSGHTDVVPVDGQQWDTNPFCATEKDGRIYGRGTCDMKGFIAVALALVPKFQTLIFQKPLHFAFSFDEEVGCTGIISLLNDLHVSKIQPAACIVGEPTDMHPVVAHKGINAFRCRVHGHATHSSLTPQGCNAIEYASQLIVKLRQMANDLQKHGPFDDYYDVPFTSLSTNQIQGGNAINTIPSCCEIVFEFRNLPSVNPDIIRHQLDQYIENELLPAMRKEIAHAKIEIESIAAAPGLEASEQAALTKLVREVTQDKIIKKVAYATEAGLFQKAGIPTVVCGPGNIEQAHRANEYITIEQLTKCEIFLWEIVSQFVQK